MKDLVIIVDGSCGPCSSLGHELAEIRGIRVISSESQEAKSFGAASSAPCLVESDKSGRIVVRRGWAMRLRLARHLGLKRADRWLSLLNAELEARQARSGRLSRRSVLLGGALTGLAAAATAIGVPSGTAAASSTKPGIRALNNSELTQALKTLPTHSKIAATDVTTGYAMASGEASAIGLADDAGRLALIPDKYPERALLVEPGSKSLTISTIDGSPLVRLTAQAGDKKVSAQQVYRDREVSPQYTNAWAKCFAECLGVTVSVDCLISCSTGAAGCALCAGARAAVCLYRCRMYW